MLKYGSDKPDLRNPILIADVKEVFDRDDVSFKAFKGKEAVRGIPAPGSATRVAAPPVLSAPAAAAALKSFACTHSSRKTAPPTPAGSLPSGRIPPISSDANRPSMPSPWCSWIARVFRFIAYTIGRNALVVGRHRSTLCGGG